ncbi:MAG: response regulator, partial [Opitutaceae bacterium]|nr:response regulator [Opitutaceae bacterium]
GGLVGFNHGTEPTRLDALNRARETNKPVVSGTVAIGAQDSGVVIYAPLTHKSELIGYAAAEYSYQKFFHALAAQRLKLMEDYSIRISIGSDPIYTSSANDPDRRDDLTLEKSYTLLDRRLRLSLTPSEAALSRDRRFLPELALGAGFGITLLLGLSVHLARSARAGQREAELSNHKLLAENDERRRIEARLKVSDERLRLALDSTQIGIFEWNVSANHVYYSPGLWSMLGYDHVRMPATVEAWQSLIHPEDLLLYQGRVDSQLQGGTAFIDPEYRMRAHNGEWRWISTRAKTVAANTDGRPARIIGTMQDITARREAEQALRVSQAEARKLSLVASKTDNPVLIGSPDGTIEWVNESFTRVMEYTLDEIVGRNPLEFMVGPETNPRTIVLIRAAMARGQGLATDVVNYSKSGRKYHLHLEIQPVFNESGQLENFIAIESDITARVETESQLRRAKAEADAASRSKSEFLASMSHEIRTPMNGVIGMTSLLMETPMNAEQRDFVNTIRTSGEALLTIINDILDFSKIESGKMEIEHMPFELALCIEEAFDLFALQASAKKLDLVYNIEPDVPGWILGDVTRLRQIIVNLVNNAVKFTPSGSIAIEVKRVTSVEGSGDFGPVRLEFAVRDSGIGIPPDRLDRLFKAFSQVDSSTTRKYGGTGLGLVISQRLSALMGGDIRVESAIGVGSAFIFTIQTEAAALQTESSLPPLPGRLQDGLILVVEDNPITQAHMRTVLEAWGALCAFTRTPAVARDFATKLLQPPVLIIIDGDETEGVSPLDELLAIKAPRLLMLPFGQTAPAAPEDGRPFATIYKPLKTAALFHAITQLFNPPAKQKGAGTGKAVRRLLAEDIPLNVLLVEDNAVNQKVALRFLERLGYRADAVGNGLEAVTTLEARHYDLVLMDLQMPEMDGFEASRQIRRRLAEDQQPKIIALTANAMQGDRELCLAAGMDDYISKPVKMHEIIEAIHRQFPQGEQVSNSPFPPPATSAS